MQSHQRQQLHQHGALPPNHYAMQQHDHPMRAPSSLCREVPTTKNIKRPAAADAGLARAVDGGAPAPHGGGGAYVPGAPRTWNSAVPAGSGRGGGGAGHHEVRFFAINEKICRTKHSGQLQEIARTPRSVCSAIVCRLVWKWYSHLTTAARGWC